MKFPRQYSLKEIASLVDCKFVGDQDFPVQGMNEIHVVTPGDIVFVDHPKYYEKALGSAATIILINKEVACPDGKALLISDDPFRDFNKLTRHFKPFQVTLKSISESAEIGEGTVIQPNAVIGNNVKIGKNCLIHANVNIGDDCIIGDNVIIHAGTVLGADAFYYKKREEGFDKLLSGGRVVIKDNVEIGSNCSIDRGVTGDTTIGKGSKLDNLIQIGHDTVIGEKCLIASQVGIAGCVVVENEVTIWGQVGIRSDVTIATGTVLMAQCGVSKDTSPNTTYWGTPFGEVRTKLKEYAAVKQLPGIIKNINK
ncbi:UDP-3-O-(3-hydroxymyristoyl)glucosamine N-acyltransferase [Christiangramia sabulilitoris]|uniref:UDP-3-O-(3-hydroxymyristoyl)glucosamine N-acyltransferase n=1 Tax=Christiangramia sabulilitoris TaxID=2583991 RepID=A0A550I5X0_9FLAO|nr:UDP-3-O-(3-hydroxymyristoyl)glucosamine N-acyltransferase [Christiangramia sabulilitoris]TRO66366.1 UDP-3-O-(3-hydroxymyristoyl)glucosamine N-acyltransferase [Christiangramia sabulilitoris]